MPPTLLIAATYFGLSLYRCVLKQGPCRILRLTHARRVRMHACIDRRCVVIASVSILAQGDHMHKWVRCAYCSRRGKSNEWHWNRTASACSWEIDSIGVLCFACYERDYPPHSEYVQKLLPVPPTTALIIAAFAYPIFANRLAFDACWNLDYAEGFD